MARSTADVTTSKTTPPVIGPLDDKDLPEAERILRLAFGTFLGAPDPETFWSDRDYVYGRQQSRHVVSFGAKVDGKLVGSNFVTHWGSAGFLGPITVHSDVHESGIGRTLLEKAMTQFDAWGTRHVELFTFAHSAKHVALYQKYGFWARFLTAIMLTPVVSRQRSSGWSRFSELNEQQRAEALRACRALADALYTGLDLTEEIRATHAHGVGDTIFLEGMGAIVAFAVCHYGPRSEAGAYCCFIKFGAVREGLSAEQDYLRLLDACEALAAAVGMPNLLAGANMARHEAYRHLVARGFRTEIQGVAMHKNNDPGYCRPGVYIIDDWR